MIIPAGTILAGILATLMATAIIEHLSAITVLLDGLKNTEMFSEVSATKANDIEAKVRRTRLSDSELRILGNVFRDGLTITWKRSHSGLAAPSRRLWCVTCLVQGDVASYIGGRDP